MSLYFCFLYIASLFHPKARLLCRGQRAAWKTLSSLPEGHWVWFHAASVGEFEQGRPIIERLRKEHPEYKILLTFFSPSGYEMRKDYPLVDAVCYLPFATRLNARRFIRLVKPQMAIFIKYEFWPAYLKGLRKTKTPTYIFSAIFRPGQLFFRWWGGAYRRLLRCFTMLFVQDEASRELLARYGVENVVVAGDTRFDRVSSIAAQGKPVPQAVRFTEPAVSTMPMMQPEPVRVLVAGSTWPADERLLARYVASHPDIRLILVPHEIDATHLHTIFQLFKGRFVRFSESTMANLRGCRTLLVDEMGLLSSLYRYATVAYVGGGFGEGIHNTIEAAVYGVPVVFGPNYHHFREAEALVATRAGVSVRSYDELERALDACFANAPELGAIAAHYVRSELGATDTIYHALFK